METRYDAWYVGWFIWSCRVMDRFAPREHAREQRYGRQTNLCHFFRTIVLGTLAAMASLMLWAWVAWVAIAMPLMLFPLAGLAMMAGTVLAILVGVVALVVGGLAIAAGMERAPEAWGRLRGTIARPERAPGFARVTWTWLVSIKQRWCPTIRFER